MILYTGYDLLSTLVSSGRRINGMYLEYSNGASASDSAIPLSRDRAYYDGLADPRGYLRITSLQPPEFRTVGAGYEANEVIFTGDTSAAEVYGPGMIDGSTWFCAAALVSITDPGDRTKDIVYNAVPLRYGSEYVPVLKRPNISVGARIRIRFAADCDVPQMLAADDVLHIGLDDIPVEFEFTGPPGSSATIFLGSTPYTVYNQGGSLCWDYGGSGQYRFIYPGESILRKAGSFTFAVIWTGFGSLRFRLGMPAANQSSSSCSSSSSRSGTSVSSCSRSSRSSSSVSRSRSSASSGSRSSSSSAAPQYWEIELTTTAPGETAYIGIVNPGPLEVDWGDGSPPVAYSTSGAKGHAYVAPGAHTVRMSGTITAFGYDRGVSGASKLTAVGVIRGVAGLTRLNLGGTSITALPPGFLDNAPNLQYALFSGCPYLATLPSGLFAAQTVLSIQGVNLYDCPMLDNLPNALFQGLGVGVLGFNFMFKGCLGLTSIPADICNYQPGATVFSNMFDGCVSLGGPAPELWNRIPTPTDTTYAFRGCTGLSNYADIPAGWK